MTRRRAGLLALALLVGCEYRHDLGGPPGGEDPRGDAGDVVGADCVGFVLPAGDCTSGGTDCETGLDCDSGLACNTEVGRCFASGADCVGTPCGSDVDCATGEICNSAADICAPWNGDNRCMPCNDAIDCGDFTCDPVDLRCD